MIFRNIARGCLLLPVCINVASAQTPALPGINTSNIVNVTSFGAIGDGLTVNTIAIQNTINAAAAGGTTNGLAGGTVEIPPGTYLCGQLTLKSKVNLQVDAGAELQFQPYPTITGSSSYLITANTITDVEISGSGTIDGNGASWWNIASAPYMIYFNKCARVLVQNVTLQNPPKQHMVFKGTTTDVTIQGITINTPSYSPNTDGMDLIGTRCVVQNCSISDGDDNIALGSTGGTTSGVLITNCIFGYGHGLSIGSNTQGGVSNLTVVNCVWTNTQFGIRMKTDTAGSSPGAGGIAQNLNYYNLNMTNVGMPVLIFSYYNEYYPPGDNITASVASSQTAGTASVPVWRNIVISNLTASGCGESLIWGRIELPVTNVTLIDCNFQSTTSDGSSYNFGIYNAHGVQIVDSKISTAYGKNTFTLYNAGVTFTNSTATNGPVTIDGLASSNSLALYRAPASLNDPTVFGANSITLYASTLTDGTSLALPASTVMNFGLGTNITTVAVSGNLSLSNTLNIANGGGFGLGTYTLFTYTGNLSGSPVLGSTPASFACVLITNIPGQINLVSGTYTNLSVLLPALATKGDGVLTNAGHVGIITPLPTNLLVHLASSDAGKLAVPATVMIPAGQTFVDFNVTILDDTLTDGPQLVTVTASAPNYASGSASMTIKDNNLYQFIMSTVASPQSAGTPFMLSLTAQTVDGSTITSYQSPASLTAAGDGGADIVLPATATAWINGVWIGGVQVNTPDTNVRLTASDGAGHGSTGNMFNVQAGSLDHFAFNGIPSPQHEAAPFPVKITAEDAGNNPLTNFTGSVSLAAFAGTSNVIFSANFEDGLDGFTIDNTIGSTNGSGNGLWHLSIGQATNGNHSAYHSLYYGQNETLSGGGNYTTGYTNEGVVTSPVIDLTGQTTPVTLSFNYSLDSEYYYYGDDYAWVEISQNGGPFTSLAYYLYPTSGWQPFSVDLSSYVGSQIQIRFHFVSYYQSYDYQGWYVDDVVINNGNTAMPLSLNPTNSTVFTNGVWTGAVAVLDAFTNVFLSAADNAGHSGNSPGFAVQGNADLAVSMFTSPDTIQAGNSLIYIVLVSNNGPERASLVTLNDPLPPNVYLGSAEVSQGTYAFNYNNNLLTCSFGSLDPGDFAIAVITVYPQVKMLLTNTVTASTGATDTNQANNTATAVTTVNGEGILSVYGSDFLPYSQDGGPFNPSGQNYTLQNNGSAALNWSVSSSATWMSIAPTSGTLPPFTYTNVFVSTNATAAGLPFGVYSNTIVFANTTDGNGTAVFNGVLTLYQSHLTVNAGQPIRTADARWFGLNAAIWDSYYDTPTTVSLLNQLGTRIIRLPGGSLSDEYHWVLNRTLMNTSQWVTSFANFIHVITNAGVNDQAIITVNYGTGTPQEAAAWVAYCNAATSSSAPIGVDANGTNWQTAGYWASLRAAAPLRGPDDGKNFLRISRTAPLNFKYWEIGNECYGTWETDSNAVANDPYTYALRATNYIALMKAVDPTIKIGVVAAPGEDSYVNNYTHSAYNQREGYYHYGWTPVMLATLNSSGVMPDFLVDHFYPESGSDNDQALLQASSNWASDAASLRQQITDYIGNNGTNIELLATENNSDSGPNGKQSTSLVNGLYLADSLAQLTTTEFNSFIWWDLRNGTDTSGDFSASLYGWRTNGDLGVVGNLNTLYPTFYTFKLMQHFVQPGDTVIAAASDFALLSTYAVRRLDGGLTILAINKDPSNTITAPVVMAGYTPVSGGTVYSYGIPQDNAAETGIGSQDIAQTNFTGAGTNFSYAFPPYSATVLTLSPVPAQLLAMPVTPAQSQFAFQLQGQTGVPYIIQSSTNLITWTSISTNTLLAGPMNITNLLAPSFPMQFWRVIWQP